MYKKVIKIILITIGILIAIPLFVLIGNLFEKKENVIVEEDVIFKKEDIEKTTTADISGYHLILNTTESEDGIFGYKDILKIYKKDKLIKEIEDFRFSPLLKEFTRDEKNEIRFIETAQDFVDYTLKDINGNGVPEFVFQGWSGGAHCCFRVYVIELGDTLSILWDFNTKDSSVEFVDINNDGIYEIETSDAVLAYWNMSFFSSPFPPIILSYDKKLNKYVPDKKLMRKTAPSKEEIKKQALPWTNYSWNGSDCMGIDGHTCAPWAYAINLIYSGNTKSAKEYIDLAWRYNEKFTSKEQFIEEFKKIIKESSYYESLSPDLINLDHL